MSKENSMPTKVDKKDLFYVQQTAKMSAGQVNIENLRIDIEQGTEPSLSDLHLKSKFGFQIQYVVPGSINKPEYFQPNLRERKKPEEPQEQIDPMVETLKDVVFQNMHTKSKFRFHEKEGKLYVFSYLGLNEGGKLRLEKKDLDYNLKVNWIKL